MTGSFNSVWSISTRYRYSIVDIDDIYIKFSVNFYVDMDIAISVNFITHVVNFISWSILTQYQYVIADVVDIDIMLGHGLVINRVKYMEISVSHPISTLDSNISQHRGL